MKRLLALALLLSLTMLSSCSLIPEEEEIRTALIVRGYEGEVYHQVPVERGDLVKTESISCKYVPVQRQELAFVREGERIDRVFVQLGDSVTEGQVLAQLELGDLEERIEAMERAIEELEVRRSHIEGLYLIDLKRLELTTEGADDEARREALEALDADYDAQLQAIDDELTISRLKLEELHGDLAERQLVAPFSGTVTYLMEVDDRTMSTYGRTVVTVSDSTRSLFRAKTRFWNFFHPGDEFTITVDRMDYTVVVTDEASLGLPPEEKLEGRDAYVYFQLKDGGAIFEDGDSGTVKIVSQRRENVLHVPKDAIIAAGDDWLVFYLREDGVKAYRMVEIGATINRRTELLSGFEEGEMIIVN